ncbi:hypothetical protein ACOMHN_033686 [Nucella lapillus]
MDSRPARSLISDTAVVLSQGKSSVSSGRQSFPAVSDRRLTSPMFLSHTGVSFGRRSLELMLSSVAVSDGPTVQGVIQYKLLQAVLILAVTASWHPPES